MMDLKRYIPIVLQTVALVGGFWGYEMKNEHRMTVIEETVRNNSETMRRLSEMQTELQQQQRRLANQLQELQRTQDSMFAIENYIHGFTKQERGRGSR